MSKQQDEINKLKTIGASIFEQFSNQIVSVLNEMQINIEKLNQRVEALEKNMNDVSNNTKIVVNNANDNDKNENKNDDEKDDDKKKEEETKKVKASIKIPKSNARSKSAPSTPRRGARGSKRSSRLSRRNKKKEAESEPKEEEKKEEEEVVEEEPEDPPKEHGDKKKLNVNFMSDHNIIKQTDNGKGALKPKFKGGSIRFGNFVSKEAGDYATFVYKFDTRGMGSTPSGYAFGLVTKGFNAYTSSNFGDNGSFMVKGNGQFITSDGFVAHKSYQHKQIIPKFKENGIFNEGDIVVVEIDVEDGFCKIYNETRNDNKFCKVQIPNKPLCCIVYMGGSAKRKIMLNEQFVYKYKAE